MRQYYHRYHQRLKFFSKNFQHVDPIVIVIVIIIIIIINFILLLVIIYYYYYYYYCHYSHYYSHYYYHYHYDRNYHHHVETAISGRRLDAYPSQRAVLIRIIRLARGPRQWSRAAGQHCYHYYQ